MPTLVRMSDGIQQEDRQDPGQDLDWQGNTREEQLAAARRAKQWGHELHERDTVSAEEEDGVFTIRLRDGRVFYDPRSGRKHDTKRPTLAGPARTRPLDLPLDESMRWFYAIGSKLSPAAWVRTMGERLLDDLRQGSED